MKKLFIFIAVTAYLIHPSPVLAQNPTLWQQNATGLKTSTNLDGKTAGLSFSVGTLQNWPFVSVQGGLKESWGRPAGPTGIELGQIKNISGTSTVPTESTDWAHNELTINAGTSGEIKVWASQLTPALLAKLQSNALRLFAGNVSGASVNPSSGAISNRTPAPSNLKYVAYSSGGTFQVRALSTTTLTLPTLDNNWLLVWYGTNSHFIDTKRPIHNPFYTLASPLCPTCWIEEPVPALQTNDTYQADVPVLVYFQNAPTSIKNSSEGGIELTFGSSGGYFSMLPLYGRERLRASDTQNWSSGLPQATKDKITYWITKLCNFPSSVSETYAYDGPLDRTTITESINFIQMCTTGTRFAPLPPFLALAKDAFPVTFSTNPTSANFSTEFGPYMGIDNASSYTWAISGLKKYTDSTRTLGSSSVPAELTTALNAEVDKLTQAGHMLPWLVGNRMSFIGPEQVGDAYWLNPADVLFHLSEIYPAISEPQKTNLINYLRSERANYPPETVYNMAFSNGTPRGAFSVPNQVNPGGQQVYNTFVTNRQDVALRRVSLFNYYGLASYYETTNEAVPTSVMTTAKNALDLDMANINWATFYPFKNFGEKKVAIINANRQFAGLVGLTKLSKRSGDSATENLAMALLAKSAVLRVAMTKYPRYIYTVNLVELPIDPAWYNKMVAGSPHGLLYNYNWTSSMDDHRQVAWLDQFGIALYDNAGFEPILLDNYPTAPGAKTGDFLPYLSAFRDLVPQLGRLLTDTVKSETEIYITKATLLSPHWYAAFAEATMGIEQNITYPIDSFQIFQAKEYIQNESAPNLSKYADISWLSNGGDLFYMHKLADTIKKYKGWTWNDAPLSRPGDFDNDGDIDINDYNIVVNLFGNPYTIYDYNNVVGNFGL